MRVFTKIAVTVAGVATFGVALGGVDAEQWDGTAPVAGAIQPSDQPTLSVMTYNVEGLPFPVRFGRSNAAHRIADRLAAMRAARLQPHVVVLQEAFGDAQRAIGRAAGYRYMAFGPDRDLAGAAATDPADRAFAAAARFLKGERSGKFVGSGLAILSDYPIVSVAKAAFPAFACAGFDCLANKGVMLATIAVPGVAQPMAVVATHLNSKTASHVSAQRWAYAWQRQVFELGKFVRAHVDAGAPYVLAGDLNIGKSPARTATVEAMLAGLPRQVSEGVVRTALGSCLSGTTRGCRIGSPADVRSSFARNKDWQAFAPGTATDVALLGVDAPFGRDARGRMLSDHIGYTAYYRLAQAQPVAAPVRMASLR